MGYISEMRKFVGHAPIPSSVELADGSILTVYYQQYGNDDFPALLYTKWTF